MNHKVFQNKYKLHVPYLQYFGVIACVSKLRRSIKLEPNDVKQEKQTIHSITSKMSSKLFYDTLIRKTGTTQKASQEKWERDVEIVNIEEMQWETIYMRSFNCTKSTKLRNFQFKLLHRQQTDVTNRFLHKIGIKNRNNCTFCEVERETLFHLFWCCRIVQSFWKILENWLIKYKILPETKSIDKLTALGLKSEYETPLVSLSTLLARNHIYTNKLAGKEPDFLRYLQLLKQHAFFGNQALKNTI